MLSFFRSFSLPVLFLAAFSGALKADQFSTVYAFGDSLSDAGNIYALSGNTIPGTPYVNGHFSNGQVWVQDLSTSLGLGSLQASLKGGNDFAYGDATSGATSFQTGTFIDLTGAAGQLAQFHALHPTADPNALYTIWIGSNDIANILGAASPAAYAADAAQVVANIDSAINTLAGDGAKNFLVLTVPDLGKTPSAISSGAAAQAAASALAGQFDLALVNGSTAAGLPSLAALAAADSLHLSVLDTYTLLDGIIANPLTYGFTNVTQPCVTGAVLYQGGTACSPDPAVQNQYLFWDSLHPTAAGHALIADAALTTITPEPASIALLGAGLLILLQRRRRA